MLSTTTTTTTPQERSTTRSEPLVQFLIGGVQKAGTTALHNMLSEHPELHLAARKEVHYFDRDIHFDNTTPDYASYHQSFDRHKNGQICGEATPSYIYKPLAIPRVRDYNPSMKWIIILRHPVERAYSHWNMQRSKGNEKLSFIEALAVEEDRLKSLPPIESKRYAYADRSRYSVQIENLLNHFDREQCFFATSEDIRVNTAACLTKITEFLGVSDFNISHQHCHTGTYASHLSDYVRKQLTNDFNEDILATQRSTQLDLASWVA